MRDLQIVHFESNPAWIDAVNQQLRAAPGEVVATASNSLGCFQIVEEIAEGTTRADALILGDIPDMSGLPRGEHMRGLMRYMAIKEVRPLTIGLASLTMAEYGIEVDVDLTQQNSHRLKEAVSILRTLTTAQLALNALTTECQSDNSIDASTYLV